MQENLIKFAKDIAYNNPILAYLFFCINSFLQIVFPPYPGDTVIVVQGYLSNLNILNTPVLIINMLISTYLSSVLLYILGYKFGAKLLYNPFVKKFFNTSKVYRLQKWFEKYGTIAIILNKFIPGVGSITLISAGAFKLPVIPALISIAVSTLLHNITLFMGGRITGQNINYIKYFLNEYIMLIVFGILIISVAYLLIKRLRFKNVLK